jgi:hypothetical protein
MYQTSGRAVITFVSVRPDVRSVAGASYNWRAHGANDSADSVAQLLEAHAIRRSARTAPPASSAQMIRSGSPESAEIRFVHRVLPERHSMSWPRVAFSWLQRGA